MSGVTSALHAELIGQCLSRNVTSFGRAGVLLEDRLELDVFLAAERALQVGELDDQDLGAVGVERQAHLRLRVPPLLELRALFGGERGDRRGRRARAVTHNTVSTRAAVLRDVDTGRAPSPES